MKKSFSLIITTVIFLNSCTTEKDLAYIQNLKQGPEDQFFPMEIPDYKIQNRDVLYITLKAINPEGVITDYLATSGSTVSGTYFQGEGGGYIFGYNVNEAGNILLPVLGMVNVAGNTLDETRQKLQEEFNKHYKNAQVDCKLLSFKFTVLGEVRSPGTYMNYNNYLTVLEAIGRAGGISDFGKRDNILVVRSADKGSRTFARPTTPSPRR
jgi:polysaccharide export outer membrane protein